jgi:uracil-DNA glycosylase family 4
MNNPGIDNEICQKCGLYKTALHPFMKIDGNENSSILIIGEAPGEEEDEQNKPFVGKPGQKLRSVLEAVDISTNVIAFGNIVRCRPLDNKISKRAINHCQTFILQDIARIDPKIVLLMGNSPLNLLGESGITTWNGVVVDRGDRTYIPLLHPAYILRNPNAMQDWLEGWMNVVDVYEGTYDISSDIDYDYPKTIFEIKNMLDYLNGFGAVAFDTETSSLDPFDDINLLLAVSFATQEKSFAIPIDHPESPFTDIELETIIDLLCEFFENFDGIIVGHNIKFDWKMAKRHLGVEIVSGADTMIMSAMLDNRKGVHGLKRLAGLHLGMYDYDKPLHDYMKAHKEANYYKGGSLAMMPLRILLPYAAMDTDATIKLFYKFWDELTSEQKALHVEIIMAASDVLSRIEYNGFVLDSYVVDRYVGVYSLIQDEYFQKMLGDVDVQQYVKDRQKDQDLQIIADAFDADIVDIKRIPYSTTDTHVIIETDLPNPRKSKKRKRNIFQFNPGSSFHVRDLFFTYKKLSKEGVPLTGTGLLSVGAETLAMFKDECEIVTSIRNYKLLDKMLSTYLVPASNGDWVSNDGRVRSNYSMHVTLTGRLSSSSPNLQNIPAPEKEPGTLLAQMPIKNIFTHTYPGGGLMDVDYSGMELRVFASLANCAPMLEIHRSGLDFHSMVALMAWAGMDLDDITHDDIAQFRKEHNEIRYKYKWTNWTLLYGGTEYTLHRLYNVDIDEAKETVNEYYRRFPEVKEFQNYCITFAENFGYIESPFGRRAKLQYINETREDLQSKRNADKRTAVNMPVQSAASDVLLCAMVVIQSIFNKHELKSLLVNTVHDSIVVDWHPDEVHTVAKICSHVMENIVDYAPEYFPSIDFSWLKSPLKADIEVGSHYGNEESYKSYCENLNVELYGGVELLS